FALPEDRTLAPGEHLVVFCDGNPGQGPLHAPFRMGGDEGRIFLLGTTALGGQQVIDAVGYPAQPPDAAWGREACGGGWASLPPTPGQSNSTLPRAARGDVDHSGRIDITDAIAILIRLFLGGRVSCPPAADVNQDGATDVSDALFLLGYLFLGGPAPAAGEVACS
ncbi:MAG: dockerin type I domain-containing protein, partial [Thermoanaerobaculia bacterium]